jgi:hypothetical protein
MATSVKKKTVAFYEILDADGQRLPATLDWDRIIGKLSAQRTRNRRHEIFSIPHWGKCYTYLDQNHLVLARSREEGVSSLDVVTDEIIDSENDIKRPWVELSVASFLPGTNKFGYVLGSQAAPRAASLVTWLNKHNVVDAPISVGPVVNQDILARLNGAAEASLLKVTLSRDQVLAAQNSEGMFSAARVLSDSYGDVEVELVVKVGGRASRRRREERINILNSARGVIHSDFKSAVAELINFDENGRTERAKINLLQDRLAKKMDVSVTDDEGNPIRIQSAVTAIMRAIYELRDELLRS